MWRRGPGHSRDACSWNQRISRLLPKIADEAGQSVVNRSLVANIRQVYMDTLDAVKLNTSHVQ